MERNGNGGTMSGAAAMGGAGVGGDEVSERETMEREREAVLHERRAARADRWLGWFVVIEGEDGAGKTTLARELAHRLGGRPHTSGDGERATHWQEGLTVLGTREPSGAMGQPIRDAARAGVRLEPWEEMAHFVAARAEHWGAVIEPALRQGFVVVCDRWHYSTMVYNVPRIEAAHGEASGARARAMALHSPKPDLCLCLLLPEDVRQRRIEARGGADVFDKLGSQRAAYEAACSGPECVFLTNPNAYLEDALEVVSRRMASYKAWLRAREYPTSKAPRYDL